MVGEKLEDCKSQGTRNSVQDCVIEIGQGSFTLRPKSYVHLNNTCILTPPFDMTMKIGENFKGPIIRWRTMFS